MLEAVRRVQGQAVDPLRLSAAPGQQSPAGRGQGDAPADRGGLGGEVRFDCRVEDLDLADGRVRGLATSSGYVPAGAGGAGHRPQRPRHL